MKTFLVSCVFLYISSMMNCSFCHCNGYDDDRIMEIPPQDSIIERLTSTCIKRSDLRRDPDQDSTYYDNYFMTFVFLKSNDTTKVIVYYDAGNIIITGNNLTVSKLMNKEILILGNVCNIELR